MCWSNNDLSCAHDCSTCEFCMPAYNPDRFVCAGSDDFYGTSVTDVPVGHFPCEEWSPSLDAFINAVERGEIVLE